MIDLKPFAALISGLSLAALAAPAAADNHLIEYTAQLPACIMAAERPADCIGMSVETCTQLEPNGASTQGTVACLLAERDFWDGMLNDEYSAARGFAETLDQRDMAIEPVFAVRVEQLRDAQRAWITYRDANCAMEAGAWGQGTFAQVLHADCQMRMTGERALDLRFHRQWFEEEAG